ncbi:uncharacterized protein [Chironomus tepperi]|uniref:uncharacterized protein n=1 Tax=Chironomus tepperi TaxID=113505 RepID=UPI00391F8D0B
MVSYNFTVKLKSDEESNKFRESGNDNYMKHNNMNALIFYNKSISYASSKKVRSLGYANRSAVYLTLGYYKECMNNIKLARENDYPANKLSTLKEREEKCKNLMLKGETNIAEDPWNFFKLSYPANKKIPGIVDCITLRTTKKFGRGIYATKDLKAGDVISIEEPFLIFLGFNDEYYKRCSNCYKTCMMDLIPCIQTASMMFCSTDCIDKFYSKSIETDLELDAEIRTLTEVSASFGGYEELDDFVYKKDLKDFKNTIFDFDLSNPEDPEYSKNLAICFLSLSSLKNQYCYQNDSSRFFKYVSKKTANHVLSLLHLNFMVDASLNDKKLPTTIFLSLSLFRSLINHACLPNVFFVLIDNKIVGFVIKPIKAGEQIMQCYYYNGDQSTKFMIFNVHNIKCDCLKCIYNNYYSKPYTKPETVMKRNYFSKAKELLKEGWHKLNLGVEEDCDYEMQNYLILCKLANYASFPC